MPNNLESKGEQKKLGNIIKEKYNTGEIQYRLQQLLKKQCERRLRQVTELHNEKLFERK